MPTEAFAKLKSVKKERIIAAAKEEFSNKTLDKASVNQIIKNANISRGSFYNYFSNIEDLYSYVLLDYKKNARNGFKEIIEKNNGDIIETFKEVVITFLDMFQKTEEKKILKNIFINFNFSTKDLFYEEHEKQSQLSLSIFKFRKDIEEEKLKLILESLMLITMHDVIGHVIHGYDREKVIKDYFKKLELFRKIIEEEGN